MHLEWTLPRVLNDLFFLLLFALCRYSGILECSGECYFGVGAMDAFDAITPSLIRKNEDVLRGSRIIALDANPPLQTLEAALDIAAIHNIPGEFFFSLYLFPLFNPMKK